MKGGCCCVRLACQPTSQQYYSLILNQHQPLATSHQLPASQQYCSLITNQHQPPTTAKQTQRLCLGCLINGHSVPRLARAVPKHQKLALTPQLWRDFILERLVAIEQFGSTKQQLFILWFATC